MDVHDRVDDPPCSILDGVALMFAVGRVAGSFTVTTAVDVAEPPGPSTVIVYEVVTVGDTVMDPFTSNTVQLQKGNAFYIFSDGFVDQTNMEGKKFMTKNFKDLLIEIQDQSMADQKEILENKLSDWMRNEPQVDDILIMGVRIE